MPSLRPKVSALAGSRNHTAALMVLPTVMIPELDEARSARVKT